MIVNESEFEDEKGVKYLAVDFTHHKSVIFRTVIELNHKPAPALHIAKSKEHAVDDFLKSSEGKYFTRKEVLKAWGKVDEYMQSIYKKEFPNGGKRKGGGRPKGTTKDTGKTESFNRAITFEEYIFLQQQLKAYREGQVKDALTPYLRQVDELFGDNEEERQKWRQKMMRTNPALLPQILELVLTSGVESLYPPYLRKLLGTKSLWFQAQATEHENKRF